jgi:Raf kinase inhibitor-like YbhB/YbcL family protein
MIASLTRRRLARILLVATAALAVAACTGSTGGTPTAHAFGESGTAPQSAVPSSPTPSPPTSPPSPTMSPETPRPTPTPGPFTLTSSAFDANGPIPAEYTCRGADRSPALAWSGVPAGTQALVLFVDDPDGRDWVHWSVLDLDPASPGLSTGIAPSADPPQQGTNDFGKAGYGGPCPPSGTHHYHFTLYALPAPLGLGGHPDGKAVRAALAEASPIAKVMLIGTVAH